MTGTDPPEPRAICLACWRRTVSMTEDPPRVPGLWTTWQPSGWPEEQCTVCQRRTNHGIYLTETSTP